MFVSPKKLFLILTIGIIIGGILLTRQIKTTRSITIKTSATPLVSPLAIELPVTATDPLLGSPGAPLTAVVFGDLGDVETSRLLTTIIKFVNQHPTNIRLFFKPTPGDHLLGNSLLAHEALWCASSNNHQFWPLLQNILPVPNLNENTLATITKKLQLDTNQLINCARLPTTKEAVLNATTVAKSMGITSSLALFVNNKQINLSEGVDVEQMLTTFIKP